MFRCAQYLRPTSTWYLSGNKSNTMRQYSVTASTQWVQAVLVMTFTGGGPGRTPLVWFVSMLICSPATAEYVFPHTITTVFSIYDLALFWVLTCGNRIINPLRTEFKPGQSFDTFNSTPSSHRRASTSTCTIKGMSLPTVSEAVLECLWRLNFRSWMLLKSRLVNFF